jgi:N-acetylglucosamine-6-phosphate deacetylase
LNDKTQERHLYPKLLHLLRPFSSREGAAVLGWHAEGPFLEPEKRGAHTHGLLRSASQGFNTFNDVYGEENLIDAEQWLLSAADPSFPDTSPVGIRIITAAPEIHGVMDAIPELTARGVIFAVGHR